MFDRILRRMRELVRTSQYVMTGHGFDQMETDRLTVFDVEHCILTGEVVERQKDRATGEWKHLVEGSTLDGMKDVVVGKIGPTVKLVIIIVYIL